jgi:hypothetical protein
MEAIMARMNVKTKADKVFTHEGGPAVSGLKPIEQLKRSVLACFLWESEFYEDGQSIADRIVAAAEKCKPEEVALLAVGARHVHNLRHAPLLLLKVLAKTGAGKPGLVSGAIEQTISRADELAEFLSIYMGDKRQPLSGQVKKGLAKAFGKFDEYALAKYNRDGKFKLRDVLFLCHAKPKDDAQKALWERLINNELQTPDTWEVALSGGADKKEAFERLLKEGTLGYLALLRNLRNMEQAGVDRELVKAALLARKGAKRVLPFRYVAAARAAPALEPVIDQALCAAIAELPALKGRTGVLVDVSGSMDAKLSARSDMTRMDAAAALAAVVNAEDLEVATFSQGLAQVPPRRGMAGVDAIVKSQPHGGTYLGQALAAFQTHLGKRGFDRIIVITDEQSHDAVQAPKAKHSYLINVASAQNGVGYRNGWTHIDGFSEGVLKYIHATEAENTLQTFTAQVTAPCSRPVHTT